VVKLPDMAGENKFDKIKKGLIERLNVDAALSGAESRVFSEMGIGETDQEKIATLRSQLLEGDTVTYPHAPDVNAPLAENRDRLQVVKDDTDFIDGVQRKVHAGGAKEISALAKEKDKKEEKKALIQLRKEEILDVRAKLEEYKTSLERLVKRGDVAADYAAISTWLREVKAQLDQYDEDGLQEILELIEIRSNDNPGALQAIENLQKTAGVEETDLVAEGEKLRSGVTTLLEHTLLFLLQKGAGYETFRKAHANLELLERHPLDVNAPRNVLQAAIDSVKPGIDQLQGILAQYDSVSEGEPGLRDQFDRLNRLFQRGEAQINKLQTRLEGLPPENAPGNPAAVAGGSEEGYWYKYLTEDQIKALPLSKVVKILSDYEVAPNPLASPESIDDPKERALVRHFQMYSPQEGENREDVIRMKLKVVTYWYGEAKHPESGNYPAADLTGGKLFELMEAQNSNVTRESIVKFTHDRVHGPLIQQMLKTGIDVVARSKGRKGYLPGRGHFTVTANGHTVQYKESDLSYRNIGSAGIEGHTPKDLLKGYLEQRFLQDPNRPPEPGKLSQEYFDIAWGLYVTFDLLGEALALQQKWTMTRGHNTHYGSQEPNFAPRPLHVMAHKLSRYGGDTNSLAWLLGLTGTYPDTWVRAKGRKGIQHLQEEILAYLRWNMPLDGIEHMINPDPRKPEQQKAFVTWMLDYSPEEVKKIIGNRATREQRTEISRLEELVARTESDRAKADLDKLKKEIYDSVSPAAKFLMAKEKFVMKYADERDRALVAGTRDIRTRIALVERIFANKDNFDVMYSRMWDESAFPTKLEYLTGLPGETEENMQRGIKITPLGLFKTATDGWEKLERFIAAELPTKDINGVHGISFDAVFGEKGLWDEFVNNGLGLAKLTPGNHKKWFVPMFLNFIGRISSLYVPELGKDVLSERERFMNTLIERIETSIADKEGGLNGLQGFPELLEKLEHERRILTVPIAEDRYQKLPAILRPVLLRVNGKMFVYKEKLEAYKAYVRMHYLREHRSANVKPNALTQWIPIPGLTGWPADLKDYRDQMSLVELPHSPASRVINLDTADNSVKKAA
jgi:hypothetical protein